MKNFIICLYATLLLHTTYGQLSIGKSAGIYLQEKSSITVQADVESMDDIKGNGTIILNGSSSQKINFNDRQVAALIINNSNNIDLLGNIRLIRGLVMENGLLKCNDNYLTFGPGIATLKGNQLSHIVTNGSGMIRFVVNKKSAKDYIVPLGDGKEFTPISLNVTGQDKEGYFDLTALNISGVGSDNLNGQNFWRIDNSHLRGNINITKVNTRLTTAAKLSGYSWQNRSWQELDVKTYLPKGVMDVYLSNNDRMNGGHQILVYPNPAKSVALVKIRSHLPANVVLYLKDVAGRTLYIKQLSLRAGINDTSIEISNLAKGVYTITTSDETRGMFRFIKE